jgi:hypothetical protein
MNAVEDAILGICGTSASTSTAAGPRTRSRSDLPMLSPLLTPSKPALSPIGSVGLWPVACTATA